MTKKIFRIYRVASSLLTAQYALMIEYRAEIALWAISGLLPLIMLALWSKSDVIGSVGLTSQEITHYFVSAFIVRQFTAVWVMVSFEEDNIEGKLSPFLLQPLPPFWRYASSHVAEQLTRIPFVFFMISILFLFVPNSFFIPKLKDFILAGIAIFLAFCVRFLIHWIFAMLCFWNERAAAIERLLLIPYLFLSGLVAPLEVFSDGVRSISMLTPYPYLLSFPSKVMSGAEVNIIGGFAALLAWGFCLFVVSIFAWRQGVKRYSAMGA